MDIWYPCSMQKPFVTQAELFVSSSDLEHPTLHALDATEAVLDWRALERPRRAARSSGRESPPGVRTCKLRLAWAAREPARLPPQLAAAQRDHTQKSGGHDGACTHLLARCHGLQPGHGQCLGQAASLKCVSARKLNQPFEISPAGGSCAGDPGPAAKYKWALPRIWNSEHRRTVLDG